MSRKRIILTASLFIHLTLFSQENSSYREIDSLSYKALVDNDWKEGRKIAKLASKEEISFYYLFLRIGVLAFDNENYDEAVYNFEKANQMNPKDTLCQEYLYYSYLLGGQVDVAQRFASLQDKSFHEKVNYQVKVLESIQISSLTLLADNMDVNKGKVILSSGNSYVGSLLNGNVYGYSFGIQNKLGRKIRLINQFTAYSTNSESVESFTFNNFKVSRPYQNKQYQYNLVASYLTDNNIYIGFGYAFFKTNTDYSYTEYDTISYDWVTNDISTAYSNNLFNVSISKKLKYIQPRLELGYVDLYDVKQYQIEGDLTYFPLGNNKFYSQTSFAFLSRDESNQQVFTEKIGVKITDKIWIDVSGRFGDLFNYQNANGLVVYNSADRVKRDLGVFCNFYLKKLDVSLGYSNQLRSGAYYNYNYLGEVTTSIYNYNSNNIITAIKWKF